MTIKRRDIMLESEQEKAKAYEEVHSLYLHGKKAELKEHKSGFPAVTVDCEDIHLLTDILSLDSWWAKRKKLEQLAGELGIKLSKE